MSRVATYFLGPRLRGFSIPFPESLELSRFISFPPVPEDTAEMFTGNKLGFPNDLGCFRN